MSGGRCDQCDSDALVTTVVTTSTVDADFEGGYFIVGGECLRDPDSIEVEVVCASCDRHRLLGSNEWEMT